MRACLEEGKLRDGISLQYGGKVNTTRETVESVWFNFTIYENGEVQIRSGDDTIIMSKQAYLALFGLYNEAVKRFEWDLEFSPSKLKEHLDRILTADLR